MDIVLNIVMSTVAALAGLLGLSDHPLAATDLEAYYSVESALAEESPRGALGGFAIPASGESQTCTLAFNPSSVDQGSPSIASWATAGSRAYFLDQIKVYRCTTGTSCADPHDHWSNSDAVAAGYTSVYSWSGNCLTGWNCPSSTSIGTGGLSQGSTYKYILLGGTYSNSGGSSGGCIDSGLCNSNTNPTMHCNASLAINSPPEPPPTKCTDGIDNDEDLLTDGADPDCVNPPPDDSEDGITVTLYVKDDNANQSWTTNDITIDAGDQVSLRWVSTGQPDSCSGNGAGFNTGGAINGTDINITEPSAGGTNNYRVLCSKTKTASKSDSLNVTTRSPVSIDADPKIVYKGETSLVTWSTGSSVPANCSVTGPEINLSPLSSTGGSQTVTVNGESTYTINCGAGGTDSVTIRILPVIQET